LSWKVSSSNHGDHFCGFKPPQQHKTKITSATRWITKGWISKPEVWKMLFLFNFGDFLGSMLILLGAFGEGKEKIISVIDTGNTRIFYRYGATTDHYLVLSHQEQSKQKIRIS